MKRRRREQTGNAAPILCFKFKTLHFGLLFLFSSATWRLAWSSLAPAGNFDPCEYIEGKPKPCRQAGREENFVNDMHFGNSSLEWTMLYTDRSISDSPDSTVGKTVAVDKSRVPVEAESRVYGPEVTKLTKSKKISGKSNKSSKSGAAKSYKNYEMKPASSKSDKQLSRFEDVGGNSIVHEVGNILAYGVSGKSSKSFDSYEVDVSELASASIEGKHDTPLSLSSKDQYDLVSKSAKLSKSLKSLKSTKSSKSVKSSISAKSTKLTKSSRSKVDEKGLDESKHTDKATVTLPSKGSGNGNSSLDENSEIPNGNVAGGQETDDANESHSDESLPPLAPATDNTESKPGSQNGVSTPSSMPTTSGKNVSPDVEQGPPLLPKELNSEKDPQSEQGLKCQSDAFTGMFGEKSQHEVLVQINYELSRDIRTPDDVRLSILPALERKLTDLILPSLMPLTCGSTNESRKLNEIDVIGTSSQPLDNIESDACRYSAKISQTECHVVSGFMTLFLAPTEALPESIAVEEIKKRTISAIKSIIGSGILINSHPAIVLVTYFDDSWLVNGVVASSQGFDDKDDSTLYPLFAVAGALFVVSGILLFAFRRSQTVQRPDDESKSLPSTINIRNEEDSVFTQTRIPLDDSDTNTLI